MAYKDYFLKPFSQGSMIEGVLKVANKKAGLESTRGGVCALITLIWTVKSIGAGSFEKGFDALMKEDVTTGKGAAFWTQVCGAFKGVQYNHDGRLSGSLGLRSNALLILSNQKYQLPKLARVNNVSDITDRTFFGLYYYLGLQHVLGSKGGHAVGLYRDAGVFGLMDPNYGLAIDVKGVIDLKKVIEDMWTYYSVANGCDLYKVDQLSYIMSQAAQQRRRAMGYPD